MKTALNNSCRNVYKFFFFLGILFSLVLLSGIGSAVGTYPAVDPNMVLYYHFNNNSAIGENDTFVVDSSPSGNNATARNTSFQSNTGILLDGSFFFNGINSSVIPYNYSSLNFEDNINFSISFWINFKINPSANQFLIARGDGGIPSQYDLYLDTSGRINTRIGQTAGTSTNSILSTNVWHYFVLTLNRNITNGLNLYVDGLLSRNSDAFNHTSFLNSTNPLYIGRRSAGSYFNGSLDEVIVYNRSLSTEEIYSNYMNYIECINVTGETGLTFNYYTKVCPDKININKTSSITFTNNSYVNFTGSSFYGNMSKIFIFVFDRNNITFDGLNLSDYIYGLNMERVSNITIKNSNINTNSNGFMLIDNSSNFLIDNSYFGYENSSPTVSGAYFRFQVDNLLIKNSFFKNCTAYGCIKFLNTWGKNNTIINNSLQGESSMLIQIMSGSNISILNNNFDNSNNNFDSYNTGIHIINYTYIPNNIFIENNLFTNMGCNGILAQGTRNLRIINNSFSYNQTYSIIKKASCGYEAITAIDLASIWKTWVSDGSENINDNVSKMSIYSAINTTIINNTFTNFPVKLRTSIPINLTHDLSNYWYRSFASPNYLIPQQDYYIDNNFNNLTTTFNETNNNPVIARDILGVGYMGSTSTIKMQFKVYNNYLYFQNVNVTQNYTTSLYNQTNSLIYFSNGSVACSDIATCDNNINITLTPNNYSYVLDNFNLTEGVTRQFSPLSISGTSTQKIITSTLSQGVNATVIVNVAQCSFRANYNGNDINEDSCVDNVATFTLTDIPGGQTNLNLVYLDIACSSNTNASVVIILVFSALAIVALTFILVMKFKAGELDTNILIIVFIAIIVGLVLFTQIAQITGGVCS